MKKMIALLALIPTAAIADAPPKEVVDMECLVGVWKGSGTMTMGKDKAKVDVTWNCKRTSAQFGVQCAAVMTGIPGLDKYEETDLFGFEPNSSTYHWFSVTNAGETHDHSAKAPAGDKVQFVYTGTQEGKPFKEVIDMSFGKDGKTLALRAETFAGGTSTSVFDVKAKK